MKGWLDKQVFAKPPSGGRGQKNGRNKAESDCFNNPWGDEVSILPGKFAIISTQVVHVISDNKGKIMFLTFLDSGWIKFIY